MLRKLAVLVALASCVPQSFGTPLSKREAGALDWMSLCRNSGPFETTLDKPAVHFPKPAARHPRKYLKSFYEKKEKKEPAKPYGRKVARWLQEFYNPGKKVDEDELEFREERDEKPIREDAPTVITYFYPSEGEDSSKPNVDQYFAYFAHLAHAREQIVVYTQEKFREQIEAIRKDDHLKIVTEYSSPWEYATNEFQGTNFRQTQMDLFKTKTGTKLKGWRFLEAKYNTPELMAIYNAKAAVMFDYIVRKNYWGSDKFVLIDFGIFKEQIFHDMDTPLSKAGYWKKLTRDLFDTDKVARSIELSGDTGVAVSQYDGHIETQPGGITFENACFTDPEWQINCKHFLASVFVGSGLGMLNFAVRFMLAVDTLEANGWYVGREELVIPYAAAMWPSTVFTIPAYSIDEELVKAVQRGANMRTAVKNWAAAKKGSTAAPEKKLNVDKTFKWPIARLAYSSYGGADNVPPMNDPIQSLFCPPAGSKYRPRKPNLQRGEGAVKNDPDAVQKAMFAKE